MWILQVSDLHIDNLASAQIPSHEIVRLISTEVRAAAQKDDALVVAFCGDAVYKGNARNYPAVRDFFQQMAAFLYNMRLEFCLCPGNHDICSGEAQPFENFNKLSWKLTHDESTLFSLDATALIRTVSNTDFILVNSAHHRDYTYGLVEINHLTETLAKSKSPAKVIVIHHSLVPIDPADKSTVANAYSVLRLAVRHRVTAILHGHCHKQVVVTVGRSQCSLVGVGSLLFPPGSNLNNQFNLLHLDNSQVKQAISFRLIADLWKADNPRGFEAAEMDVI